MPGHDTGREGPAPTASFVTSDQYPGNAGLFSCLEIQITSFTGIHFHGMLLRASFDKVLCLFLSPVWQLQLSPSLSDDIRSIGGKRTDQKNAAQEQIKAKPIRQPKEKSSGSKTTKPVSSLVNPHLLICETRVFLQVAPNSHRP
jgi:hypothetical protein